jgi:hypothetical protein
MQCQVVKIGRDSPSKNVFVSCFSFEWTKNEKKRDEGRWVEVLKGAKEKRRKKRRETRHRGLEYSQPP